MFSKISDFPYISKGQMVEVDRLMIDHYRIELLQMMENAGRGLAKVVNSIYLSNNPSGKKILVLAGKGGNGGGALAAARRLYGWGAKITVVITKNREAFQPVSRHQLDIINKLKIDVLLASDQSKGEISFNVIIDGIIGYNISGNPRGASKDLTNLANKSKAKVVSLDIPSGVDPDRGMIYDPYIKADTTVTLALPKLSFKDRITRSALGRLFLADIGVPPDLYKDIFGSSKFRNPFYQNDIVELI